MKKVDYWWWEGVDLAPMFQRVQELGTDNVRIQFNPHEELLYVIPTGDTADKRGITTFNYSHICPPDCGNGD